MATTTYPDNMNCPRQRAELGKALRDVRRARYLSVNDAAHALNVLPCHILLMEEAAYNPQSQQGIFLNWVSEYARFADISLTVAGLEAANMAANSVQAMGGRVSSLRPKKDDVQGHFSPVLVAGVMALTLTVALSLLRLAEPSGTEFFASSSLTPQTVALNEPALSLFPHSPTEPTELIQQAPLQFIEPAADTDSELVFVQADIESENAEQELITAPLAEAVAIETIEFTESAEADVTVFISGLRTIASRS